MLSFDVSPSENPVNSNRLGDPIECLKPTGGNLRRGFVMLMRFVESLVLCYYYQILDLKG